MATIAWETPIEVDASAVGALQIIQLDATNYLAAYVDTGNWRVRVLTLSGVTLTPAGTDYLVDGSGNTVRCRMVTMSSSRALIVYEDGSNNIQARFLDISGTVVTVRGATALTESSAITLGLCALSSTVAFYCFDDGSLSTDARILTTSTNTVVENTKYNVWANFADEIYPTTLSATEVLLFFGSISVPAAMYITIAGTVITTNAKRVIPNFGVNTSPTYATIWQAKLSATKTIFCFTANSASGGESVGVHVGIFTVSGTTVSEGTLTLISGSGISTNCSCEVLDASNIALAIEEASGPRAYLYSISGTSLTFEDSDLLGGGTTGLLALAPVDSTHVICHYNATSDASIITAAIVVPFTGYDLILGGGLP